MMNVHGKMLVRNFKQLLTDTYGISVKVHQGFSMGQTADDDATVATARSGQAGDLGRGISLKSTMTVQQAEDAIRDAMGFAVQILDARGANADNGLQLSAVGFREPSAPVPASEPGPSAASSTQTAISVTGQKKLSTIQAEFTAKFSHLGLLFFSLDEAKKAEGGGQIRPLHPDRTVASVRTKTAKGDMSIHGNTTVGSVESGFAEDYGLYVQVCFMKDSKPVYSGSALDGLSLSELNRKVGDQGRGAFVYPT
jgi:hypothetical protein